MMIRRFRRRVTMSFRPRFIPFTLLLAFAGVVVAQLDSASLNGTVTDPTGAVVPAAKVSAQQSGTGLEFTAESNGSGGYSLVGLPIGEYSVSVEKEGFQTTVRSGLSLT